MNGLNQGFWKICGTLPALALPPGTVAGRFLRREKRFSVAVRVSEGETWAHTNNTGTMLGLIRPGTPALLSPAQNDKRTLRWTLEALWHGGAYPDESALPPGRTPFVHGTGFWVGVNTAVPNRLLEASFHGGTLPFGEGYTRFRREVRIGQSRMDGCLERDNSDGSVSRLWVECKNVTLVEDGVALFPDAVSARALKHLDELQTLVDSDDRAAMLYVIQRPDARCFAPADMIDPAYAEKFSTLRGVEVYPVVVNRK